MIDTHAHIFLPEFENEISQVLERAIQAGVSDILMPAINEESWLQMLTMPKNPNIRLHKMFGIHPCEVQNDISEFESLLYKYGSLSEMVAVGETGLDYYWSTEWKKTQKESLHLHFEAAKSLKKPIVLHNRNSTDDLLEMISTHQDGSLTGVWHCFNGTVDEGKKAIAMGFKLGIGGVVTFKNAGVDKTLKEIPLEALILETDSPYLAPTPYRGKQNEPSYLTKVVEKLTDVYQKSEDEIIQSTNKQARNLFKI